MPIPMGIPLPIIGGIPPIPGGAMPPIPATGAPPSPIGACPVGIFGKAPLPAPTATPGPPGANRPVALGGGGPSTAILTTFSPLRIINPRFLFSCLSSMIFALFPFNVRNSSVSQRTKFKCLSNARNVPVIVRESVSVMRRRCST